MEIKIDSEGLTLYSSTRNNCLLTLSMIDKALAMINIQKLRYLQKNKRYEGSPLLHEISQSDYNHGLCYIFNEITHDPDKTWLIVRSLLQIDNLNGYEAYSVSDYIPKWGDDWYVEPNKWYEKRVGVLLKARDMITNQTYEYYV